MKVTVAICTWNRSRLLTQTLEHFKRMVIPPELPWEILVVDNGSTDSTRAVLASFSNSLPIRSLHQPISGHSRSRNLAIEHANSDLMIWTDDDVLVEKDWLVAYVAGAAKYPEAAFFGGPIAPVFENGSPDWLQATWPKCSPAFAARDLGETEANIPPAKFPYGANFAVRTSLQKTFLFDVSLGRQASSMLGEDEIDLFRRLIQAGHHGVWLPAPKLKHFITADRSTAEYVGRYFIGQGWANIHYGRPTFQSRFHALRVAIHNHLCYRLKRNRAKPDEWVSHLIRAGIAWGEFQAWKQQRDEPNRINELEPPPDSGKVQA
jgi:glucosyl-dolichyl phosphate glucuronosyltransferase